MAILGRNSFERTQDLAVPWEQELPPEKRRYDVRYIRGGPGKSGMGIVYLAYDREHDAPYAIKTFQDRFLGSPRAVENFKKEAEVWVELGKHKNIVRAYYVEIHTGRPYIFMEMVAGDELYGADLSGWIGRRGLDLPLMLNVAIQFCWGMSHAEQRFKEMGRTFVHQDIKPQNIMVTRDKVVKVTDFGLVYVARDKAFEPVMIGDTIHSRFSIVNQRVGGTYFYLSPEQILQGPERLKQLGVLKEEPTVPSLDLCSDLYAFGCVLYEMVTGRPPFYEWPLNLPRYFSQTLYEEPASINSGDKEFDKLIMQLLRKKPEERGYRSFAVLEEALQGIHARLTGERMKEESFEETEAWELANRGMSFASLGQVERAMAEYDKALTLNLEDAAAYINRGAAYDRLGQYERAIADFDKAISLNPGFAEAYHNRGFAYDHLGQSERAIAGYDTAIRLNPGFAMAYNNRGVAYADLGQVERAIAEYDRAIRLNPGFAEAYYNRGIAYADLGQFERAIAEYDRAITLNPGDAEAYHNRGNAYYHFEQYERAIAEYDRAIRLNPGFAKAYTSRGAAYAQLGKSERAIVEYDQAIEFNPEYANAYTNRGDAYYHLGQFEQAIADFNQSIILNPGLVMVYIKRGCAYSQLGQFERAIADFEKATTLNPGYAAAYYNRGNAYAHLGQFEWAIADYSRFIELAPPQDAQYIAAAKERIRQLEAQIRRK